MDVIPIGYQHIEHLLASKGGKKMAYDRFQRTSYVPSPVGRATETEAEGEKPRTRRRFVVEAIGGIAGVALVGACGADEEVTNGSGAGGGAGDGGRSGAGNSGSGGSSGAAGSTTGGSSGASGAAGNAGTGGETDSGRCALYPQQTPGPFYLDLDLVRSDITEGKPGTLLTLEIQVVGESCAPIRDAIVDVWQCDAAGVYAGFAGQLGGLDTTGQTFLRGSQITDADGRAVFKTIYPGWYPGRTTHIHFKVHLSPTSEVTSQLYFPEDVTTGVYQSPPYAARGQKDTSNAADGTAQMGGFPPVLAVTQGASGLIAKLSVTVLG
jgi:protocatechuate 3,4-dioxygenase beta subunit